MPDLFREGVQQLLWQFAHGVSRQGLHQIEWPREKDRIDAPSKISQNCRTTGTGSHHERGQQTIAGTALIGVPAVLLCLILAVRRPGAGNNAPAVN